MMNDIWKKIQPLKIPTGWLVEYNNFYDYEPTPENMDWFYGSCLFCASSEQAKLTFESRYEPEGDPEGCLIIDFLSMEYNHKSKEVEINGHLGAISTKSKQEFIDIIEHFMFFREIPPTLSNRIEHIDSKTGIVSMGDFFQSAVIYQFNKKYWIVEESRQLWPRDEGATRYIGVSYSADEDVPDDELGKALIDALDNFNKTKPEYPAWEIDKTREKLALSMGAKDWPGLFKNSRSLVIARTIDGIKMIPVDNCNIENYEIRIDEFIITIPNTSSNQEIGAAIKKTMAVSTYHPKRRL